MTVDGPDAGHVYTVPAGAPFAKNMATFLWNMADQNPDVLATFQILLPTRRAQRALAKALAAYNTHNATLLPSSHTLGDLEPDEPPFLPGYTLPALLPAASVLQRRSVLAKLILHWHHNLKRPCTMATALQLADELTRLFDTCILEGVGHLDDIDNVVTEDMAEHWQLSAQFLSIAAKAWPMWLAEHDLMDPTMRQVKILQALAQSIQKHPPKSPLILAGSTGAMPAVTQVMHMVAKSRNGIVVLPGLDQDMDDDTWQQIDMGHPQRALKAALDTLSLDRSKVKILPGIKLTDNANAKNKLLTTSLTPASATADWPSRIQSIFPNQSTGNSPPHGLEWLIVDDNHDASAQIALALQNATKNPEKSAVLITPDLTLAEGVMAKLDISNIRYNCTVGQSFTTTAFGHLLQLSIACLKDPENLHHLFALMKHPALSHPMDPLHKTEKHIRQSQPQHVSNTAAGFVQNAHQHIKDIFELHAECNVSDWLAAHIELLQSLCHKGAPSLWCLQGADAATQMISQLSRDTTDLGAIPLTDYLQIIEHHTSGTTVPRPSQDNPQIEILGTLESRLVGADFVILAGLEEGVWPTLAEPEIMLSRPLRAQLGLPPLETRIGLAAHDFTQAACAPHVMFVRRKRIDDKPALASRWLWRLETVLKGAKITPPQNTQYASWAQQLSQPAAIAPATQPRPAPPLSIRPNAMSVTRIEEWVRDPYAIYARMVLRLKALDDLGQKPGARERGNAWHMAAEALDEPEISANDLVEKLNGALKKYNFSEDHIAREILRFSPVATALIIQQRELSPQTQTHIENMGKITFPSALGAFTLSAKADRIDVIDGQVSVVDYKTGSVPTTKEVKTGLRLQLPLTGYIALGGGFTGINAKTISNLSYIKLGNPRTPVDIRSLDAEAASVDQAMAHLHRLIDRFANPDEPYASRVAMQKYTDVGNYDDLARVSEWLREADEPEGQNT